MATDDVFKALADPTRRQILKMLREGEMTAGDIAARFQISAPSMSHHFSVLKAAGLIFARRSGQTVVYALNTTVFQDVLTGLLELFAHRDDTGRTKGAKGEDP